MEVNKNWNTFDLKLGQRFPQQAVVTAHLSSKQLLLFAFAWQFSHKTTTHHDTTNDNIHHRCDLLF